MIEAEKKKKKRRLNARDVFDNHRRSTPNVVLFSRAIYANEPFSLGHVNINATISATPEEQST